MRFLIPPLATHGARWMGRYFPDLLWRKDPAERVVYLTFDDGPTAKLTTPILDALDRYEASATFFLVGAQARKHPDLARRIAEAGHTIGNHTFTHPHPWRTPGIDLQVELDRTSEALRDIVRRPVRYMRPPYGEVTPTLRTWCAERNCPCVMWDVMPGDYLQSATADGVARFVLKHVRPGSIIVLHDNPICEGVTRPALETVLRRLSREGWQFKAL